MIFRSRGDIKQKFRYYNNGSSDNTTNRSSDTITQKARGDIKQKFRYYNNGSSDNTTTEVQTLQLQGKGATDEGNSLRILLQTVFTQHKLFQLPGLG